MRPKAFSMFEMDVMSKGLSWIDGMYQKFETICIEVDDNPSSLLEETKMYVENQFNVIGENVKKFYAEVIEDILPPDPDAALKNLASNMTVSLGEGFDLSEKLNTENLKRLDSKSMPHEKLEQSFAYAGEDSNCVSPFPHELQRDIPVIYLEETSEYEILEPISSLYRDRFLPEESSESEIFEPVPSLYDRDTFLSEDSILKDVTQTQFHSEREANLCNNIPHVAYLAQGPTCVPTVAEQEPWKEKGSNSESGTEFHIDNQKSRDMCGVDEMKVNDNSLTRNGIVEIIGKSAKHFTEETNDTKENPEGHEKDAENIMAAVKTFIPKNPCLSKEELSYEILAGQEDEIEESAYWYGYEDMDVEKWEDIEKCDSDWELL